MHIRKSSEKNLKRLIKKRKTIQYQRNSKTEKKEVGVNRIMARVISLKNVAENKYIYEIELDSDEAKQINGSIKNLVLFSEGDFCSETNISKRGKDGRTKYFLIPKNVRKRTSLSDKRIICQRLDLKNKTFFIYAVDKGQTYN